MDPAKTSGIRKLWYRKQTPLTPHMGWYDINVGIPALIAPFARSPKKAYDEMYVVELQGLF